MKFSKTYTLIILLSMLTVGGYAQSASAGKCFSLDYVKWCELSYPSVYINCGNDAAFNVGSQLTMELWVRAYTFGENRKIMGKLDNQFNNGYVLGFENLNAYAEIFNPELQEVPRVGVGSMPLDSAWVHMATTYDANGQMVNYINGEKVGEVSVFPQNPIASNTNPFIIGLAPWDLVSYEFVGNLDEVRIWNVAKTEQQIKEGMFHQLNGDESGLVAYYNFNSDVDSIVHDNGANQLNGLLHNSTSTCFFWDHSFAPIGDSIMGAQVDIQASWYGKDPDQYTYALTQNGLSLITSIKSKEFWKYLVFGHNNKSGVTTADAPVDAPVDFQRLSRVWYVNQGGEFTSQVVFNLQDAANGGAMLPVNADDSLYTLLVRNDTTGDFEALYTATQVMGNTILFDDVNLQDSYYTLGYSSKKLAGTASIKEFKKTTNASIYPNPVRDNLYVYLNEAADLTITELSGKNIKQVSAEKGNNILSIDGLAKGIYFIRIKYKSQLETRKVVVY